MNVNSMDNGDIIVEYSTDAHNIHTNNQTIENSISKQSNSKKVVNVKTMDRPTHSILYSFFFFMK
jgi:hypothetical protein